MTDVGVAKPSIIEVEVDSATVAVDGDGAEPVLFGLTVAEAGLTVGDVGRGIAEEQWPGGVIA